MDTHALLWSAVVMLATGLFGLAIKEIAVFKASKVAQANPALARIADIADDICSAGMAFLTANPTATPHAAAAWALSELKASAPALITQAGSLASDEALSYMVNRKLVTAAQAAPISEAATSVITALAPSAVTARITPTQLAVTVAATSALAPEAEKAVQALIQEALAHVTPTQLAAIATVAIATVASGAV